jgi:hypothetical protein
MDELSTLLIKLRGRESLREVAERSNKRISHSYLNILEKGFDPRSGKPIKPTPESLRVISDLYGYSYEKLMILAGYLDRVPSTVSLIDRKKAEIKKALLTIVAHDDGEFPIEDSLIDIIYDGMMKGREFHAKKKKDK